MTWVRCLVQGDGYMCTLWGLLGRSERFFSVLGDAEETFPGPTPILGNGDMNDVRSVSLRRRVVGVFLV